MSGKKAVKKNASHIESDEIKFEEALNKLEGIVAKLEDGDVPLDQALTLYEDGVKLSGICQQQLQQAQQRVAMLEDNGQLITRTILDEDKGNDDDWDKELDEDDEDEDDEEDDEEDDDDEDFEEDDDDKNSQSTSTCKKSRSKQSDLF